MAGNISVARWLNSRIKFGYDDTPYQNTPKTWKFLGEGSSRVAYLDPRNTVWKVEDNYSNANESEYEQYRMLKDVLPDMFILPETSLYRVKGNAILAMEYIPGEHPDACPCYDYHWDDVSRAVGCEDSRYCWKKISERYESILSDFGINDFHPGNVLMTEDDRMVLIDFAC